MSVNQKSGHGTLLAVQLTPGGAFSTVAELGDITPPELTRNEFDGSAQNENIDSYVVSTLLRRGVFSTTLNWIPDAATHDHLTGVYKLLIQNTMTGWKITFPQVTPAVDWIASGQITSLKPGAPVDGKLVSDMSIRFSGLMIIGGSVVGT